LVEVARSSRGSGDRGVEGVGNLAHFMHIITIFNMDNIIFSLTAGAQTGAGEGGSPPGRGVQSLLSMMQDASWAK